jgi:tetratricopeptide (TPR) repeat protein
MRQLLGDLYQLAGRNDEARAARRVVSQSLAANPESIDEWTAWLLDRSAWDAVSELADLQSESLPKQPKLLYALAESRSHLHGDAKQVNQLLDQALQAADASDDREHYECALFLEETRGQFAWAEREYRFLIEKVDHASLFRTNAFYRLAGMYHKQQQDAKAAEVLQELLTEVQSSAEVREALRKGLGSSVAAADCQRHYFLALDAESRGDEAGKRDELQKAVDIDPEQADVLIAMYRVKDADADWSEQVRELIRASAERLQREIIGLRRQEEVAGDLVSRTSGQTLSGTLNNYAWLISNTEGDFEEALRFSQQSLLLSPGDAGLLDTLARCYYSVGELDKALKYQRWAVQRDPHETQVRRQLEFFESELASQQQPVPAPDTQSKSDG